MIGGGGGDHDDDDDNNNNNRGSKFLLNVSIACLTTQHHIPEDTRVLN
jgi:hypothetical protein